MCYNKNNSNINFTRGVQFEKIRKWLAMAMVSSLFGGLTIGGTNVSAAKKVRLENIGGSCYFNSAIQSIYASDYLREKVLDIYKINLPTEGLPEDLPKELDLCFKFAELFNKMKEVEENALIDAGFMRSKIKKFVSPGGTSLNVIVSFLESLKNFDECLCEHYMPIESIENFRPFLDNAIKRNNLSCFFLSNFRECKNWDAPLIYDLGDEVTYEAKSIIVAIGEHAICFVKQDDGCWRCFDDAKQDERVYTTGEVFSRGIIKTIFYEMKIR